MRDPESAILSAFYIAVTNTGPKRQMVIGGTGRYESLVVKTKGQPRRIWHAWRGQANPGSPYWM